MKLNMWIKKNENRIITGAAVALLAVFVAVSFDYFYDLNDDVLMKDILAGAYTGTPEGHNIQMLYLVSAFISLFYKAARGLPWYGLFLCFCHFGCFSLILSRSLTFCKSVGGKIIMAMTEGLFWGGLFLEHLVFAQYTVTCTLLAGTAAFLFYTTDIELDGRTFIKKNIPAVLLVSIAYLIRSEMLLLVLPMICVAGVAKWGSEEQIFTREHQMKYLTVIGLILAGILFGQITYRIAYGSEEWRTFIEFFDNRTELYDFQQPPSFEEHREFYEGIGLTKSEKVLLDNYNFGMDEEIDEVMVGAIAEYAGKVKSAETSFWGKLSVKLRDYIYRFTHGRGAAGSDYPWNYAALLGYFMVFATAVPGKYTEEKIQESGKGTYLKNVLGISWKLGLLFVVRTLLWMFILMRDRAPERITHSLYLMELCVLGAMIFAHWQKICRLKSRRILAAFAIVGFGVAAILILPENVQKVSEKQAEREAVNDRFQELYDYFGNEENKDNFYLIDVYSSVSYDSVPYSEKMFKNVDNSIDNYDIMGGWACKSPLQRKKFAKFGLEDMEQALREKENVYFVRQKEEDMQWLLDYYKGHGTPVKVTLTDTVAEVFEVYKVEAKAPQA